MGSGPSITGKILTVQTNGSTIWATNTSNKDIKLTVERHSRDGVQHVDTLVIKSNAVAARLVTREHHDDMVDKHKNAWGATKFFFIAKKPDTTTTVDKDILAVIVMQYKEGNTYWGYPAPELLDVGYQCYIEDPVVRKNKCKQADMIRHEQISVMQAVREYMRRGGRARMDYVNARDVNRKANALKACRAIEAEMVHWIKGNVRPRYTESNPSHCQYLFASAPEYDLEKAPVLALAGALMEALNYKNVAGDAKDSFHTDVMTPQEMDRATQGWRTAWKGKVETGIHFSKEKGPVRLVTIDGGAECQWEVRELREVIVPSFARRGSDIQLAQQCASWELFVLYILQV